MLRKRNGNNPIITTDMYELTAYKFSNGSVSLIDAKDSISKQSTFISYLNFKDIATTTIQIPKETSEDDLLDEISQSIYKELELNPQNEYKISYLESFSDTQNRLFNVFIAEHETIIKAYKNISTKIPYIDYLIAAPLLYSVVYKQDLQHTSNDCFVSLSKDDAFICVYSNTKYLCSRPLRYSINYIKDKFIEQSKERISDMSFYEILQNGIKINDDENGYNADLDSILSDFAFAVNNIISIISRIYLIDIDRIFIDSQLGEIKNLDKLMQAKLEIKSENLILNSNRSKTKPNNKHELMALLAKNYKSDFYPEFNFSVMLRPAPFARRKSGKFILTLLCVVALSLAYPIYNYIAGFILQKSAKTLDNGLKDKALRIQNRLNEIASQNAILQEQNKVVLEALAQKQNFITQIYNRKNNYVMKSINIYEISRLINESETQILALSNYDTNITLAVISNDDKKIANLIRLLLNVPKYSVRADKIYFNQTQKNYESNISVAIR
ncbi:C4-dicarboxylate ABC transporter [Campylobacter sp. faydin G-140]|uniref:C4-dicarboxylate ABC transporter n=1 Tax=Campylobacter anatolicus TaxID=2829105 RepID=UPI001B94F38F|nr:C4-dicarboxylate ABC transporter [Campylobacter anatolicus]MBR8465950.1 C4-dicarboxylate ABC transporter [Campylobacter anatolicus]